MTTPRKIEPPHGDPAQAGTEPAPGLSRDQGNALESLGAELLRRAEETQPVLEASWDALMARWGVHGQPVGIQRLRERIQEECASKPGDHALSRELIALREEHRQ